MDIEYLLWLQSFREASGNVLTPFMVLLSDFVDSDNEILLVPIFVYWCLSKRGGMFLMLSTSVSNFLNDIIKMTFCVYRPFIRDVRVVPAVRKPSSYSFPSGHVMSATSILGGLAVLSRKKYLWFSLLCALVVPIVMLSRNCLGVHTPQDVVAGLAASLIVMYAVSIIMSHSEYENIFAAFGILAVISGILYVSLKSYPMDYGENGKLLVNYASKIDKVYSYGGYLTGLIIGRFVEKRYVNFRASGFNLKGVIVSCIGLGLFYALFFSAQKSCVNFLEPFITEWGGKFAHSFVSMFFAVALWPCAVKIFCRDDK